MATPADWLDEFVNSVSLAVRGFDFLSPLGCHCRELDGVQEITLFASLTEIQGGSRDGALRPCRFQVDVESVRRKFSHVESIEWQSHRLGEDDDLGAHLSIRGMVGDQSVWLRILAMPPEKYRAPGRIARIHDGTLEEIW